MKKVMSNPSYDWDAGNIETLFAGTPAGMVICSATITSSVPGRGVLRFKLDWGIQNLACDPNDTSDFTWFLAKTADGAGIAIGTNYSPEVQGPIYASCRPDNQYYLSMQSPGFQWITEIDADEIYTLETADDFLSVAFKGLNGNYVAVCDAETTMGPYTQRTAYEIQANTPVINQQATWIFSNIVPAQSETQWLINYVFGSDDFKAISDAYGLSLATAELNKLIGEFVKLTPYMLAEFAQQNQIVMRDHGSDVLERETATKYAMSVEVVDDNGEMVVVEKITEVETDASTVTIGTVVGGIAGGVIGGFMAGPPGAVAGAGVGAAFGNNVGLAATLHQKAPDSPSVIDKSNPMVSKTFVAWAPPLPAGPYINNKIWEDILKFTHFYQIGDMGLPNATIVYPPAPPQNKVLQLYSPTTHEVIPFLYDSQYSHEETELTKIIVCTAIFVIVKVGQADNDFQMRFYPDDPFINAGERPNHSQLTSGSRLFSLMSNDDFEVYAAGELKVLLDGTIVAITSKTGHFFVRSDPATFDANVYSTTKQMLTKLGYNTDDIMEQSEYYAWLQGYTVDIVEVENTTQIPA